MRIMGLDFGSKTVGVAVSDPLYITAQGVEIIRRKEEKHSHVSCETTRKRKLHKCSHMNCRSNPYAQGAEC